MKRAFDIFFSFFGLILILPILLIIALLVIIDSKGGVFYFQQRVGKDSTNFKLYKFRTMRTDAHKFGLLTVGKRDPRVTRVGFYLRKFKLDELPQLINVLNGSMSFVGPRPEVSRYVELYTMEQRKVLTVKPGITDYASIEYANENELLAKSDDPEKTYIEEIMPRKIDLNMKYINKMDIIEDVKIIFLTFWKILR